MMKLNDGRDELWQWDTGRKLTVDADCSEVHFSNRVYGRSVDVPVVDGIAKIPDVLLQMDNDLYAWGFVGTPEDGYTKISKVLHINRRNKPADYVFTPPEQTTLDEILGRINAFEQGEPERITTAIEQYLTENPITAADVNAVPQNQGVENAGKFLGINESGEVVPVDAPSGGSGGTDIALGITGATVGQVPAVKSVDENGVPTEWDATDMASGGDGTWRTIAEIQTDGTVNQYEITQDADGNPLNLTEMIIRYVGLKGETVNTYQAVWINDVQVSYRHALNTTSATKYETFWMRKTGKYIYGICNEATKDGISGMNTAWRAGGIYLSSEVFPNDEGIQKIRLGNNSVAVPDYLNGITITIFGK